MPIASTKPASVPWEEVSTKLDRRCVLMEIYGDSDTGRTTLALTAPGPIAYIHANEKKEGLIHNVKRAGTSIRMVNFGGAFRGSPDDVMREASAAVDLMETAIIDAYKWARSIILDTHTEAWEVIQLGRLGSLTREGRSEADNRRGQLVYSELNNRWRSLFKEFRVRAESDNRTNFIVIGQTKPEYKATAGSSAKQASGRTIRGGQKETLFLCDASVRTKRDPRGKFTAVIEKPWWNNLVRDLEVEGEYMTFPEIMGFITDGDAEEWRK